MTTPFWTSLVVATGLATHLPPTELSPVEASQDGLRAYTPLEVDAEDADEPVFQLSLGAVRTTLNQAASDTETRAVQATVQRVLRQRLAHVEYCAPKVDPAQSGPSVELEVRVDDQGMVQVSSATAPDFATCLTPLAALWPLPDSVRGSKSRVTVWVRPVVSAAR